MSVSNLTLSYDNGKSSILRDISFCLRKWEILSIIGKNWSGKSSLLKAIAGIHTPHSWSITKNIDKVSYVPQKLHLDKSFPLRVKEFFKIFNTMTDQKIDQICQLFDITNLLDRNIHVLSWWEFQKVLIANALLSEPELLLLDEPTSGIDIIWEQDFYKNIALVRETYPNIGIILVSHNLHLVYKNSNKVICLHDNNLCCHGTPHEVLENEEVHGIFGEYLRPYEHKPHSHHNH